MVKELSQQGYAIVLTTEALSELYDVDLRVFHSEALGRTTCSSAKL